MKKFSALVIFSMILLITTSLCASCHKGHKEVFRGGTFVGILRKNIEIQLPVLIQYVFNEDGTGYWNESNSLALPMTTGTFISEVGTWKRIKDRIILTTFGAIATPVIVPPGINDINLASFTRTTQEFKIIDNNTLQAVHRLSLAIGLDQDPLTSPGIPPPILNSCDVFLAKRVRITPKDLTNNPCP